MASRSGSKELGEARVGERTVQRKLGWWWNTAYNMDAVLLFVTMAEWSEENGEVVEDSIRQQYLTASDIPGRQFQWFDYQGYDVIRPFLSVDGIVASQLQQITAANKVDFDAVVLAITASLKEAFERWDKVVDDAP